MYLREKLNRIDVLPILVIAFISGIIFAHFVGLSFLSLCLLSFFTLGLGYIFLNYPARAAAFLFIAFFLLGALRLSGRNTLSKDHILNIAGPRATSVQLIGSVVSHPTLKKSKLRFNLLLKSISTDTIQTKTGGKILVIVDEKSQDKIFYADILRLKGRLYRPFNFKDRKARTDFDYRGFLSRQDIYFIMNIKNKEDIEILGQDSRYLIRRRLEQISYRLNALLFANLPQPVATVYAAIILGRRETSYLDLREFFIKSGTAHILAISGLHIGIIAFILVMLLKILRIKMRARLIICALALIFYCILTCLRPPVVRATIMALFLMAGFLIEREVSIYNGLSLAAFLLLLFEPRYLFDAGFQLSFTAVLGIISLAPCLSQILTQILRPSFMKFPVITFSVSLAAWLSITPIVLYHFNMINPLAILTNVIVVPTLGIILALGFAFLIAACLLPPLAGILATAAGMACAILIHIVSWFSQLPGAYFYVNFRIHPVILLFYYSLLIFSVVWFASGKHRLSEKYRCA